MEDITIQYEKVVIGDNWYLFKPIGIVKGIADVEQEIFETEFGTVLYYIGGGEPDMDLYCSPSITLSQLREIYGEENESILLAQYFLMSTQKCILGFYDSESIKIINIPFNDLEKAIKKSVNLLEDDHEESSIEFVLDKKTLTELRNLKSLNEIRNRLDSMINMSDDDILGIEEPEEIEEISKLSLKKGESNKFSYKKLKQTVLSNIIAQDKAVTDVTTTIAINRKSKDPKHKSHILIAGPSGTGKTEMMNIITKELGIPCFKADATAYTKEGYVGKSVYSMLNGLLDAADGDIDIAENGVLIIDEIDKKSASDIFGQDVLYSMLKLMDREVIELNIGPHGTVLFDTSNLTIVFMGAFSDLIEKKSTKKTSVGFTNVEGQNNFDMGNLVLTEQDFIDYGMPSEFMGRIGKITFTNKFSKENLIQILKKSKISPLKMEQEFFNDLGIKLTYTSGYINEIADRSQKSKLGARNLKKIVKESLKYVYEEILLNEQIKEVRLTKETVDNSKKYYIK